jgi:tetratricopeptide (TPR) repeat protein
MICPNCGSNMSDKKKRCDRCGTDMTIYRRIYRASNKYYNTGLARAKVRDLSGAVTALKSSLELNKLNTGARNLLGLVYYEMGETVAALSEWVISKHFQPESNDADEYINKVQSNPTKLDTLNQAIKRYNTALTLAKQGSDDLAIIQLKKVVTLNPHFLRAIHLLALLHIKNNEKDRARKLLVKALKIDVSNTTTLRYLKEMEQQLPQAKDDSNPETEARGTGAIMPVSSYREDKPNIMAFINLVVGVVIGLAVTAFLVVPTLKHRWSESNPDVVDYGAELAQMEENEKTIASLQSEKEELEHKVEQLQTQLDNIVIPEDKSILYNPLLQVTQLYLAELDKSERERDYLTVAEQLTTIDETKLDNEDAKALVTILRDAVYPTVARLYYKKGHDQLYNSGKYEEALEELEKAMYFDPTDVDAVYFIARSYHRLGDHPNAAIYYNIVITDFPDSSRVSEAKRLLKQVQEQEEE